MEFFIDLMVVIIGFAIVLIAFKIVFSNNKSHLFDDEFRFIDDDSELFSINELYPMSGPVHYWIEGDSLDNLCILNLNALELNLCDFSPATIKSIIHSSIKYEKSDKVVSFYENVNMSPYVVYGNKYSKDTNSSLSQILRYLYDQPMNDDIRVINHSSLSNDELKKYFTFVKSKDSIISKNKKCIVIKGDFYEIEEYQDEAAKLKEVNSYEFIDSPKPINWQDYKAIKYCMENLN